MTQKFAMPLVIHPFPTSDAVALPPSPDLDSQFDIVAASSSSLRINALSFSIAIDDNYHLMFIAFDNVFHAAVYQICRTFVLEKIQFSAEFLQ
ncbi:hypothetical protein MtrunA17_Chr2g0311351 [Medicago truncatula]|uniref:Uncharacterized protein n=1 Tax=Medicago truncatula TaxID=3880 RepID=A0A072V922_MEDTR|nr:hypothetical protein MTR_2g067470 [Medicago truncatula]RHN74524.1 hypothetical protein MtrunA17_Chr2g0311351 [Medicago truncatula]